MLLNSNEYTKKPVCGWWRMLYDFVSTCAVTFCTKIGHNKTRGFGTEGFVPVSSLCGVVGSPSWCTKCLIGRTVNIWSLVYINAKCIYSSENLACNIIKCTTVRNVHHANLICPFIYWWYGAGKSINTPLTEIPSWKSLGVSCVPASVLILSIYLQLN